MTSILKADNIQDADGNNIINENSNKINIGASGDTTNIIGTLQNDGAAVGGANTPNFKVDLSSTVSVPTATNVKITWDEEQWDTASAFASNKFTVPSGQAGKYFFYAQYVMPDLGGSDKQMQVKIYKNGAEAAYGYDRGERDRTVEVSTVLNLSVSDYIEVYARQNGGTTVNILADDSGTFFLGYKLIE